jgi:iron complex transport system substrate-binding protein
MLKTLMRALVFYIRQFGHICQSFIWQTAPMRRWSSLGLALALGLTSCTNAQNAKSVTISQNDVSAISVSNAVSFLVSRVVVLANGVAEIIDALGGHSILVGRDISSTEKSMADIPIVTSGHQIISEKVVALKPDLVIIDASSGPKAAIDQIKSAGIRVVQTPESWTLSDIAPKVSAVAAAIGSQNAGAQLITAMENSLADSRISTPARVAFLYLRGTSSIYLIGGPGSGADSIIAAIGATDVGAQSLPHAFNTLTAEALAKAQPDVILVMSKGLESVGGVKGLVKLPGVAQTPAGKNSRIIDVDDSLLLSFGPRTPSLVSALSKALVEVMKK